MTEATVAIPSETGSLPTFPHREQGFLSPQLPEVVQKFLETSRAQGAIMIPLTQERISFFDTSNDTHPYGSFNRRFMRDYPVVFNDHAPRNRIVHSYLTPEIPINLSGSIEFILQPNALARDSAHGVFFGNLRPASNNGLSGIQVAVKPYSGETTLRAYSRAWREFINSHVVSQRGIPTIKPLILIFDDRNAYIVSRRERLTALGDIIWEPFRRELGTLRTPQDIEQFIQSKYRHLIETNLGSGFASSDQQLSQYLITLRNLALCLGQLHLKGIFPQDSQIKNFVSETITNQVWAIDWENTFITFRNIDTAIQTGQAGHEGKSAYYGITQLLLSLLIKRNRQEIERGLTGIGLFDLYFSNALKGIRAQKPEIIDEMRKISPQLIGKNNSPYYSEQLLDATNKISKDVLTLFEALFLQHYRAYISSHHPNPRQILEEEQVYKLKMFRHITDILIRDVDYYLSLT